MQAAGLAVDNSEAQGALSDEAITERDLLAGRWDGAEVRLWEVDWTDSARRRLVFRGALGEIVRSGGAFRAELRGLSEALNRRQGRVYHPRCSAALGDARCRLDLSAPGYQAEGRVESVAGEGERLWCGASRATSRAGSSAASWWCSTPGRGAGGGWSRMTRPCPARGARLSQGQRWALFLLVGDRVRLVAGCDKRAETCRAKFVNMANFRGFPHLPPEDWLLAPGAAR